jgi:hypothetical protein
MPKKFEKRYLMDTANRKTERRNLNRLDCLFQSLVASPLQHKDEGSIMRFVFKVCILLTVVLAGTSATAQRALKPSPLYQNGWFQGPPEAYLRLGVGAGSFGISDGKWAPPGAPPNGSDPIVFFDLSEPDNAVGTIAIGRKVRQNMRGEIALTHFGREDISGPWSYTVPSSLGPHASVSTTFQSTALMANVFYDLPKMGRGDFRVQPYIMGGLGVAWNKMGDWTRINTDKPQPTRTFEGDTNSDFAFALGVGAGWTVGKSKAGPITLDVMYQFFDLGSAKGSSTVLSGGQGDAPVDPLSFDVTSHVISFGVRIPLNLR